MINIDANQRPPQIMLICGYLKHALTQAAMRIQATPFRVPEGNAIHNLLLMQTLYIIILTF